MFIIHIRRKHREHTSLFKCPFYVLSILRHVSVQEVYYVLAGKSPGGKRPEGKCPGGMCPGDICPWGKCPGGIYVLVCYILEPRE